MLRNPHCEHFKFCIGLPKKQEERDRIRKCQREGIDNVLNEELPFGRPKAQVSQELIEAYQ